MRGLNAACQIGSADKLHVLFSFICSALLVDYVAMSYKVGSVWSEDIILLNEVDKLAKLDWT